MNEQTIRLTNIKSIGWSSLLIFGILTLWVAFELGRSIVFVSSVNTMYAGQEDFNDTFTEMNDSINQTRVILLIVGSLTLFTTVGAFGLIRLKTWGLIVYQSFTIVILLALLGGLAFYIYYTKTEMSLLSNKELYKEMNPYFAASQDYRTIQYGVFALLFSWLLTRVNIFLSRRATRSELR
jgi:hypothetical protein